MSFDPSKCFDLQAIRLKQSAFSSALGLADKLIDSSRCLVQSRGWQNHRYTTRGDNEKTLVVYVHCGVRLMEPSDSDSDSDQENALYTIEACFVAEFKVIDESHSEEEFNAFIAKNAPHVIWPFWRQHVFSTLQSASLPAIPIPLMAQVKKPSAK